MTGYRELLFSFKRNIRRIRRCTPLQWDSVRVAPPSKTRFLSIILFLIGMKNNVQKLHWYSMFSKCVHIFKSQGPLMKKCYFRSIDPFKMSSVNAGCDSTNMILWSKLLNFLMIFILGRQKIKCTTFTKYISICQIWYSLRELSYLWYIF